MISSPSPSPPPLPATPRGPWGFWTTLGWGVLVFTAGDAALELWKSIFTPFLRAWISVTGDAPPVAAQVAGQAELFARFVWLLMVLFILRWLILRRNGPGISDYLGLRRFSPWRLVLWVSIFAGVLIVGTALAVLSGDQSGSKSQERLVSSRAPILHRVSTIARRRASVG